MLLSGAELELEPRRQPPMPTFSAALQLWAEASTSRPSD